jgi:hypothetical protein
MAYPSSDFAFKFTTLCTKKFHFLGIYCNFRTDFSDLFKHIHPSRTDQCSILNGWDGWDVGAVVGMVGMVRMVGLWLGWWGWGCGWDGGAVVDIPLESFELDEEHGKAVLDDNRD